MGKRGRGTSAGAVHEGDWRFVALRESVLPRLDGKVSGSKIVERLFFDIRKNGKHPAAGLIFSNPRSGSPVTLPRQPPLGRNPFTFSCEIIASVMFLMWLLHWLRRAVSRAA